MLLQAIRKLQKQKQQQQQQQQQQQNPNNLQKHTLRFEKKNT